jgi:hypothetical protein
MKSQLLCKGSIKLSDYFPEDGSVVDYRNAVLLKIDDGQSAKRNMWQ